MNSPFSRWASLGLLALSALACDPAAADRVTGELVWEVESQGVGVVSLFGTVHSRSLDEARSFHPGALAKFDQSTILYVETDLSAIDLARYSENALLAPGAPGLDTQLTPSEWAQLSQATGDLLPVDVLRRARPWYAAQLFLLASVPSRLPPGVKAMDLALIDEARARGAEVRFLEHWTEQVLALSVTADLDQLKASLSLSAEEHERSQRGLETEWEQGNASALEARLSELNAEQQRLLLDERNERWGSVVEGAILAGEKKVFVAVGAAHLLRGSKGLPAILRERRLLVSRRP